MEADQAGYGRMASHLFFPEGGDEEEASPPALKRTRREKRGV